MEKITEYGKIKISDNVFEKMIKEALSLTNGRDSLAMERRSIIIEEDENEIRVEFHVTHKFGISMFFSSMTVMNHIEGSIRSINIGKPVKVIMKIVAIKAKRSIKVDHEITRTVV